MDGQIGCLVTINNWQRHVIVVHKLFAKALLGRDDVGVDAEGVDEAPRVNVLMKASCFDFVEGVGKGPPTKGVWRRGCRCSRQRWW